jgi:hypothetical protein
LGSSDIFSEECRPSQTAHQPLSQGQALVSGAARDGRCYIGASPSPRRGWDRRLPATLCIPSRSAATGCSKAPQGLLSPLGVRGLFAHVMWVHGAPGRDSGALVDPFMHVGTHPTRHLATFLPGPNPLSNHQKHEYKERILREDFKFRSESL